MLTVEELLKQLEASGVVHPRPGLGPQINREVHVGPFTVYETIFHGLMESTTVEVQIVLAQRPLGIDLHVYGGGARLSDEKKLLGLGLEAMSRIDPAPFSDLAGQIREIQRSTGSSGRPALARVMEGDPLC